MEAYNATAPTVEISPDRIIWGQTSPYNVPMPTDPPADIEAAAPYGPDDDAWWAENAPDPDEMADAQVDALYAERLEESWPDERWTLGAGPEACPTCRGVGAVWGGRGWLLCCDCDHVPPAGFPPVRVRPVGPSGDGRPRDEDMAWSRS